jgi:hypothetical protein
LPAINNLNRKRIPTLTPPFQSVIHSAFFSLLEKVYLCQSTQMKKLFCIPVIFIFLTIHSHGQKTIIDYIKLIPLGNCYSTDLPINDTTVDEQNGYLELGCSNIEGGVVILQIKIFENADSTVTIATSGLYSDEQCQFHHTSFFEYSPKTDSVKLIPDEDILPELTLDSFLRNSKAPKILSSYLREIRKNYLGKDATLDDVLREIYSQHFIISPTENIMTISLDVCDYIPTNAVKIKDKDWKIVESNFIKLNVVHDKKKKRFVLKS